MKINTVKQYDVQCSCCSYYETSDSNEHETVKEFEKLLKAAGWKYKQSENICPSCAAE